MSTIDDTSGSDGTGSDFSSRSSTANSSRPSTAYSSSRPSTGDSTGSKGSNLTLESINTEYDGQQLNHSEMINQLLEKIDSNSVQAEVVKFVYRDSENLQTASKKNSDLLKYVYFLIKKMDGSEDYNDEINKVCDELVKLSNTFYTYGELKDYNRVIDYLIHDVIFLDKYLKDYLNQTTTDGVTIENLQELNNRRDHRNSIRKEIRIVQYGDTNTNRNTNTNTNKNALNRIIDYVHIDDKLEKQEKTDRNNWEAKNVPDNEQQSEYDKYIKNLYKHLLAFQNNYRKYDFDIEKLIGVIDINKNFTINKELNRDAPKYLTYFLGIDYNNYKSREYQNGIKDFYFFEGIKPEAAAAAEAEAAVEILDKTRLGNTKTNAIIDKFVDNIKKLNNDDNTNIDPELIKTIFSVKEIEDEGIKVKRNTRKTPEETIERLKLIMKQKFGNKALLPGININNLKAGLDLMLFIKNNYPKLTRWQTDDNVVNKAIKDAVIKVKTGDKINGTPYKDYFNNNKNNNLQDHINKF